MSTWTHDETAAVESLRRERDEAVSRAEKLQVAYDAVRSGHGWCRCHDAIEPLTAEVARLTKLNIILGAKLDDIDAALNEHSERPVLTRIEWLLAEVARLRAAIDAALHELGVPQPGYLVAAPIDAAAKVLRAALEVKP